MATVTVPDELLTRLRRVVDDTDGFDTEEEFVEYVLSEVVAELQTDGRASSAGDHEDDVEQPDDADDDVEEHLRDLGYI